MRWKGLGQMVLDLFSSPPDPPPPEPATKVAPVASGGERGRWGTRGEARHAQLSGLSVVFSRRMKRSWRLEHPRTRPVLHLPERLESAPPQVWSALGDWVLAQTRPSPGSRARARSAARLVFEWMGDVPTKLPVAEVQGTRHNLRAVFDRINAECFGGAVEATIRWSPRPGGLSTHRIVPTKEGPRHLITIGQVYDLPEVPLFALEGVVHHEMLHILHPPRSNGPLRRHVHHREFRTAEASFPNHVLWKEWELREMPRLLRKIRRKIRK
jgi:hypothetical protein